MSRASVIRVVASSAVLSATGKSSVEIDTTYSQVVEIWIDVTAVAGSGNMTYSLDTSLETDALASLEATDTHWRTQKNTGAVTVAGRYSLIVSCQNSEAVGNRLRVSWVLNSGTSQTTAIWAVLRE